MAYGICFDLKGFPVSLGAYPGEPLVMTVHNLQHG